MIVSEPSTVVGGWECVVLAVALRDYQRRHGFGRLPSDQQRDVDRAISDMEEAGRRWRSGVLTSGQGRSDPAPVADVGQIGFGSASPPELLTVGEVAEILAVSVSTVRRMIGAGRLSTVLVGGRSVRYRKDDVDELVRGTSNGD